jgi:hypothetical protein
MRSKPEYRKGPEVAKEFEDAMKRIFQTPKPDSAGKKPKETTERKADRD